VQAMHIHDGQLLVVYNTNKLYRYDAETGEYLGSTELAGSDSSRVACDFSQPGQLALLLGTDLHLIDLDSWQVYTVVEDCFGYMAEENMTFVRGYAGEDSYSLGIFKICGYEELTRRAEAVLGELELTSEQKARYGIE